MEERAGEERERRRTVRRTWSLTGGVAVTVASPPSPCSPARGLTREEREDDTVWSAW